MKIDVLYQFNEKYAPYAGVSITSLFENNRHFDHIRVFILGEGLSSESRSRIRKTAAKYGREIVYVETEELIRKMKAMNMPSYRGSYAANMRLFLPDVLEETVERLLYLDSDTVIEGALDCFVDFPMGNAPVAMALDSLVRLHKQRIGFAAGESYYNSGVILFQMKTWREQRCTEEIVRHIRTERAHYPSPDQDLLNVVCRGKIKTLGPECNLQPIHLAFSGKAYFFCFGKKGYYVPEQIAKAAKHPVVLHFFRFVGEFPWNSGNVHPDSEYFDRYLSLSEWADYRKEPSEAGFVFKFEKILYRILPGSVFIPVFRAAYEFFIWKANRDSLHQKINELM